MNTTTTATITTRALAGLGGALALTAAAGAGFTGVEPIDVSAQVGTPPGLKTIHLFATFDDPTDELLGVGAEEGFGSLEFTTDDPEGLRNQCIPGLPQDTPQQFCQTWDTWVTIASAGVTFSPDFPANGDPPFFAGTSFSLADGVWFTTDFLPGGAPGPSVLIAQFTIGQLFDFELSGVVMWRDVQHPGFATSNFTVATSGGSTGGACCLTPPTCIITTAAGCATLGGTFLGVGVACATQIVDAPCHPGDVALHCVSVVLTCPDGEEGPGCVPGPLVDAWKSPAPIEPGDPSSYHDFGGAGQAIPADFFGPGSDPFTSSVGLVSEPLGVVDLTGIGGGIVDFGEADTLILRSADPFDRCDLPGPLVSLVDIEIVELSLKSLQPIVVTFDGGMNPQLWDVFVDLSAVQPPPGSMAVTKTHCNGGVYEITSLPVQPRFTFVNVDDPKQVQVLDTGVEAIPPVVLTLNNANWVSDLGASIATMSPYCTDFHPGIEDEFVVTECDCNSNNVRDLCDVETGFSGDCNFNLVPDECEFPPCDEDLDGNHCVGFSDLLQLLGAWGPCPPVCPQDLSGNLQVDFADLLILLGAWGPCD